MSRLCRIVIASFAALYALALVLWAIGTFGLFSAERDPLAGVFLLPLGLPWVLAVDLFPELLWPWLSLACPALTLSAMIWLCGRRN